MENVTFEYEGRQLNATVLVMPINSRTAKDGDFEAHVEKCEDSITGEKVPLTNAIKAAVIFALRSENQEIAEFHGDIKSEFRIFPPK